MPPKAYLRGPGSPSRYAIPGFQTAFEQMRHEQFGWSDWVTRTAAEFAISEEDASAWLAEMDESTAIYWSQKTAYEVSSIPSEVNPKLKSTTMRRLSPKKYNWPPPLFHLLQKKLVRYCPQQGRYVKVDKQLQGQAGCHSPRRQSPRRRGSEDTAASSRQ